MIVIAGFHAFSSSKIDKHTVPDGYTFGWNNAGVNLPKLHVNPIPNAFPPQTTYISVVWRDNLPSQVNTNT